MRVIVCGSRTWTSYGAVSDHINSVLCDNLVVVHGACRTGADEHARLVCVALGIEQEPHPADWERHGKTAGFIRNGEMADAGASLCIAFWDGRSRGTLDMITRATKVGILVRIVPAVRISARRLAP